jgi:hypothetical protein
MPAKAGDGKTEQISVTLSTRVVELLQELADLGIHGTSRGEVARTLISAKLEQLAADGLITLKPPGAANTPSSGAKPDASRRR